MNDFWNHFTGPNAGYVQELYEKYRQDPASVDAATRAIFERWKPPEAEAVPPVYPQAGLAVAADKVAGSVRLAQAIRTSGYLSADLDPLGAPPPGDPWHEYSFYGITEEDLRNLPASVIGGPLAEESENALDAIQGLMQVYTTTIGYDYGHIQIPEERDWLRQAAECGEFRPPQEPIDRIALLHRLTEIDAFEQFLHRIFPGKTRFSIEGLDMLIPMLDEMLGCAAQADICTSLIGMAHRGRLNVLAHVLGKPYEQILAEFKDPQLHFPTRDELGWTGDVKYHKGAYRAVKGGDEILIVLNLPPNPSHLEHVDPVVEGMARAAGSKVDQPGQPEFFPSASLPVLIHGDASFTGQGVVAETLNMSHLPGYSVGGTVHIIENNQLGYTTNPSSGRSTLYASDLAKGFEIPIIHVNADDPIGCIEAARTAFEYRERFHKDFLIDLIGYRRYGHNEGDEPTFTQPLMYETIEKHPPIRQIWANTLISAGEIQENVPEELFREKMNEMQQVMEDLEAEGEEELEEMLEPQLQPPPHGLARQVDTAVPLSELEALNQALLQVPEGFHIHSKVERGMRRRKNIFEDPDKPAIDWATAEELAFASILADGIPIRMTGEDVERGTFSQRHAVFHDVENGEAYVPLQEIPQAKASFEIQNSPLSENAALGFEFGYNITFPRRFVLWEAQYGDFVNTAQAMIDEFILSARAKWEQTPSLVMLLPHGQEGQGPDHSTGRPERFLQMAADINLRLANCTTSAQYFHLLRRQAALLESDPLPLIVLTPKSLLRHPLVASPPRAFAEGRWQPVIDDAQAAQHPQQVQRVILCNGKVFIDLVTADQRQNTPEIAIVRVEQLYPFPAADLHQVLEEYPNKQEVVWVQEEPENMGAWTYISPLLEELLEGAWPLRYIGRQPYSSPAEGSSAMHSIVQSNLIERAYDLESIRVKES